MNSVWQRPHLCTSSSSAMSLWSAGLSRASSLRPNPPKGGIRTRGTFLCSPRWAKNTLRGQTASPILQRSAEVAPTPGRAASSRVPTVHLSRWGGLRLSCPEPPPQMRGWRPRERLGDAGICPSQFGGGERSGVRLLGLHMPLGVLVTTFGSISSSVQWASLVRVCRLQRHPRGSTPQAHCT